MYLRYFVPALFLVFASVTYHTTAQNSSSNVMLPQSFPNTLHLQNTPDSSNQRYLSVFSDLGAWFGYALPSNDKKQSWGAFSGPMLVGSGNTWLAAALAVPQFYLNNASNPLQYSQSTTQSFISYPGHLYQSYQFEQVTIEMRLIFTSANSTLTQITLHNTGSKTQTIRYNWQFQALYPHEKTLLKHKQIHQTSLYFTNNWQYEHYSLNKQKFKVKANGSQTFYSFQTLIQDSSKTEHTSLTTAQKQLENGQQAFQKNTQRWQNYLQQLLDTPTKQSLIYQNGLVKCLQTLVSNWKVAHNGLPIEGVIPSYAPGYFHGFWAWDSWKHAVALAPLMPNLAKNQVLAMLHFQDKHGMVADCVFADSLENNWRNTKPPLAAWAVAQIYKHTHDTAFVKMVYPHLKQYHQWWYKHRDHNSNGLCEYGSTDGTLIAAAWESGMDNAVRFDEAKIVQNNSQAWSLTQESVDLNSYLYAEKNYLSQLCQIQGFTQESEMYLLEAQKLQKAIQQYMYDPETRYFYDIDLYTQKPIKSQQGPEAWIALWAGVANQEQAQGVRDVILDSLHFNTLVPCPTLSAAHVKFNPQKGYWRGPVWLDQAYFAIKGLHNYGFKEDADQLKHKLLHNTQGFLNSSQAIHENYHPITGKALNVPHFSWSAAHFMLLLRQQ